MRNISWELWKSPTAAHHALVTAEVALKVLHLKCCSIKGSHFRRENDGEGSIKTCPREGWLRDLAWLGGCYCSYSYPRSVYSEVGLVSSALAERTWGSGPQLHPGWFRLDTWKKVWTESVVRHWNNLPREVVESPLMVLKVSSSFDSVILYVCNAGFAAIKCWGGNSVSGS